MEDFEKQNVSQPELHVSHTQVCIYYTVIVQLLG